MRPTYKKPLNKAFDKPLQSESVDSRQQSTISKPQIALGMAYLSVTRQNTKRPHFTKEIQIAFYCYRFLIA